MSMEANCLQTRRELMADPNNRNSDVMQHVSSCESCEKFFQAIKSFDVKLKLAVDTDVPEGLESRIILAQRMANSSEDAETNIIPIKREKSNRSYQWMSMAAALVLAVGLSLGMFKWGESQSVQNEVIAYVENNLEDLEKDENVKLASLNGFLNKYGITANEGIGYVRHVSTCPIEGKVVARLVVADEKGKPVTVMYLPWEDVKQSKQFSTKRFKGVLVGAQKGSFAIVTEDPNTLDSMEERVLTSMEVKI